MHALCQTRGPTSTPLHPLTAATAARAARQGHALDRAARTHLVALPGQPAAQQEEQRVGERLEVVAPAGRPPQVRVHARIPHLQAVEGRARHEACAGIRQRKKACCGREQISASKERAAVKTGARSWCQEGHEGGRTEPRQGQKRAPARPPTHRAAEDVRSLVILHVRAAHRVLPPRRCGRAIPSTQAAQPSRSAWHFSHSAQHLPTSRFAIPQLRRLALLCLPLSSRPCALSSPTGQWRGAPLQAHTLSPASPLLSPSPPLPSPSQPLPSPPLPSPPEPPCVQQTSDVFGRRTCGPCRHHSSTSLPFPGLT